MSCLFSSDLVLSSQLNIGGFGMNELVYDPSQFVLIG